MSASAATVATRSTFTSRFISGRSQHANTHASFQVVSKDTVFDPLLAFMKEKGIAVRRSASLQEPVPVDETKIGRVLECLRGMVKNRPGSRKSLGSAIATFFAANPLPSGEVQRLIDELVRRNFVSVKSGGKLAYSLPA